MKLQIVRLLVFVIVTACITSCSQEMGHDEIWREKIELSDSEHIMLYHSRSCTKAKPFFASTVKKIYFSRKKYDVFDYCFDDNEIDALLAISKCNISKRIEHYDIFVEDSSDFEYFREWLLVSDTTNRSPYKCYYGLKNDSLIELKEAYLP